MRRQESTQKQKRFTKVFASLLAISLLISSCNSGEILKTIGGNKNQTTVTQNEPSQDDSQTSQDKNSTSNNEQKDKSKPTDRHFNLEEASKRKGKNALGHEPLSTVEIAEKTKAAVVAITTTGVKESALGMFEFQSAGSGVLISEDGYIVTNNHVVANATQIDVILATGETYRAKLVGTAPSNDIAVIKIEEKKLPFVEIGNSDDLKVGELAVAVGNPLGDFHGTVTTGIISSLGRRLVLEGSVELTNLIQTDAAINSGNSGGGLFNSYGELIGINVAKVSSSRNAAPVEGLGFAIPINTVTPIVNSLINKGYLEGMPSLGIYGSDVSENMAKAYPEILVPGVWIRDIAENSPVLKAGLKIGDIITGLAGEKITSVAELNIVKNRYKAGDEVEIEFYRNGETHKSKVTLAEAQHD